MLQNTLLINVSRRDAGMISCSRNGCIHIYKDETMITKLPLFTDPFPSSSSNLHHEYIQDLLQSSLQCTQVQIWFLGVFFHWKTPLLQCKVVPCLTRVVALVVAGMHVLWIVQDVHRYCQAACAISVNKIK